MAKELDNIHERVSKLESNLNNLAENVNRFINASALHDEATNSKLDNIYNRIASAGKVNWGWLGTIFGVCMAIVGYYVNAQVTPVHQELTSYKENINGRMIAYDSVQEKIIDSRIRIAVMENEWALLLSSNLKASPQILTQGPTIDSKP